MKTFALTTAAVVTLAAAPAMAAGFASEVDADGNGSLSLEELQMAYPALTEETFVRIDLDADGEASVEEVTAAQDAGLLVSNG
ncbi:EF-hand domain-containing protein [Phaeobacter sp. B1627]|uniref:EF-hand domain-containing protein n=1 Tax=Phaeobacter sp. B1627 TaxID=2583809 RepID=UPI0011190DFB|nr:EF-hand domain-containing protein [Phaeobacter sp. B1627]TNJ40859.1 EF-hand domain-containing protein [Phaeobacter sp. B1627]